MMGITLSRNCDQKWLLLLIMLTMTHPTSLDENFSTFPNLFKIRFIYGTTMGLYMAVVVPIDLPGREAYLGWFFEAIHSTPSNQTSYEYPPLLEREIDRKLVYNAVEHKIESSGYPGKACLLRTICEIAMHSVDMANGVLGDLLHIIFMPSTTINFNLPPEYTDAERCGRKHECTVYHKNCTTSFLDMISFIEDTL